MEGVSGELYDTDGFPAPFSADRALATQLGEKGNSLLTLTGHVNVRSEMQGATMSCDQLEWFEGRNMVKGKGHVVASGKFGKLGPAVEMWAASDLSLISTPAMWDPKLIPSKPKSKAKKP
jgi:hypothetical protein